MNLFIQFSRAEYPCAMSSLPTDLRPRGNGLIFRKEWPFTEMLNFHLLKVKYIL